MINTPAWMTDDQKTEMLYRAAERRVYSEVNLLHFANTILADWPEGDDHWEWVIEASTEEIVGWAQMCRVD